MPPEARAAWVLAGSAWLVACSAAPGAPSQLAASPSAQATAPQAAPSPAVPAAPPVSPPAPSSAAATPTPRGTGIGAGFTIPKPAASAASGTPPLPAAKTDAEALRQAGELAQECFDHGTRAPGTESTRLVIVASVEIDGRVSDARVRDADSDLGRLDSVTVRCITDGVLGVRFPTASDERVITIPFAFQAP